MNLNLNIYKTKSIYLNRTCHWIKPTFLYLYFNIACVKVLSCHILVYGIEDEIEISQKELWKTYFMLTTSVYFIWRKHTMTRLYLIIRKKNLLIQSLVKLFMVEYLLMVYFSMKYQKKIYDFWVLINDTYVQIWVFKYDNRTLVP